MDLFIFVLKLFYQILKMTDGMEFAREVKAVVDAIPAGKVLTYGDVAALAGRPTCARQVGKILGAFGFDSKTPCHRVVNFQGRTAPHWHEQTKLLKNEGVEFTPSGLVNMKRHHWNLDLL